MDRQPSAGPQLNERRRRRYEALSADEIARERSKAHVWFDVFWSRVARVVVLLFMVWVIITIVMYVLYVVAFEILKRIGIPSLP